MSMLGLRPSSMTEMSAMLGPIRTTLRALGGRKYLVDMESETLGYLGMER